MDATESQSRRKGSARNNRNWFQNLMCCLKSPEDEVHQLDFCHCSLSDVPAEVFNYERTLEELHLDCNSIADLPRPLFHCHELRTLTLSDNEISELPTAIASLINLQVLDISKNSLGEVPDMIKGCKALTVLDLSINPLGKFAEGGTQLLSLEELYLNDTFLEFLPANFGRLTKLRVLELRENQLATLPKSMARLTSLQRLDVGYNDLCDVPEVIGSLPSLTELWLDGNKLEILPGFIGNLKKLTHLDVSKNDLHEISPNISFCTSLIDLTLSSNNLEALPEEIAGLSNLTILRLDDNQLNCLPESIGQLANLQELQVGQNRLTKIPASIGLLRKLHTLLADNNQLNEVPSELGSCQQLTVLSLRNNKIECLPPEIGHLSKMRVMNLSCNKLKHLPVSFLKFPSLTALWLSEAQTKPIVPLQTDTDSSTGRKVLTCFLLPQTDPVERVEEKPEASPRARLEPRIKFAPDNELERPGRLMRNPTPYPKELKALAKHAQMLQTSQTATKNTKPKLATPPAEEKVVVNEPAVQKTDDKTNVLTAVAANEVKVSVEDYTQPSVLLAVTPMLSPISPTEKLVNESRIPPSPVAANKIPENSLITKESVFRSPAANDSPKKDRLEIEVREAKVLKPKSDDITTKQRAEVTPAAIEVKTIPEANNISDEITEIAELTDLTERGRPEQPPPYHVAAAFSRHAADFVTLHTEEKIKLETDEPRIEPYIPTASTVGQREPVCRESSPGQDSGRGQSVEPLEIPGDKTEEPEKIVESKPPLQKRDTYILIKAPEPVGLSDDSAETPEDQTTDNVPDSLITTWNFTKEPTIPVVASPPPAALPLSAANIVGLPNLQQTFVSSPKQLTSRLPPPKVHLNPEPPKTNGVQPTDPKSPAQSAGLSRIPLPMGSKLVRQSSNLSSASSGHDSTDTPTLVPQPLKSLSTTVSSSRIPAPQVHVPTIKTVATPPKQATPTAAQQTKIPLPKVHSGQLDPAGSKIPSRLPLTSAIGKHRITPDPVRSTSSPMAWSQD